MCCASCARTLTRGTSQQYLISHEKGPGFSCLFLFFSSPPSAGRVFVSIARLPTNSQPLGRKGGLKKKESSQRRIFDYSNKAINYAEAVEDDELMKDSPPFNLFFFPGKGGIALPFSVWPHVRKVVVWGRVGWGGVGWGSLFPVPASGNTR